MLEILGWTVLTLGIGAAISMIFVFFENKSKKK